MSEDVRSRFERKVRDCYTQQYNAWMRKQPVDLVERAEEIAAVQRTARELPNSVSEEDAAYLLRFKDPLEVVADAWLSEDALRMESGLTDVLWDLRDKRSAEADYEMEPEFYDAGEGPLLSM